MCLSGATCVRVDQHVSEWSDMCQSGATCVRVERHVSEWINMCLSGATCVRVERHVAEWSDMCQSGATCVKVDQHVSEWSDMSTCWLLFQWQIHYKILTQCVSLVQHICHHYFFLKATCSRHDIAEKCSLSVKQQALIHHLVPLWQNHSLIHGIMLEASVLENGKRFQYTYAHQNDVNINEWTSEWHFFNANSAISSYIMVRTS
jgi:hypothetical protein